MRKVSQSDESHYKCVANLANGSSRALFAGTMHNADAQHVHVDLEEGIPIVAAVGDVPDKAGKEMTVGAQNRFSFLEACFLLPKRARLSA